MTEDFGYDRWTESKSRRENRKEIKNYNKKYCKSKLSNNNDYIRINNLNSKFNEVQIKCKDKENKVYDINLPENCVISLNKKKNWILADALNALNVVNSEINEQKANKSKKKANKSNLSTCVYDDFENECKYIINYKVNQNETEINFEDCVGDRNEMSVPKISKRKQAKKKVHDNKDEEGVEEKQDLFYDFDVFMKTKNSGMNKDCSKKVKSNSKQRNKESKLKFELIEYEQKTDHVDDISNKMALQIVSASKDFIQTNFTTFKPFIGQKVYTTESDVNAIFSKDLLNGAKINENQIDTICEICCNPTFQIFEPDLCKHGACAQCWRSYAEITIKSFKGSFSKNSNSNESKYISCIYSGCDTKLSLEFLSSILPNELMRKLTKFYCEIKLTRSDSYFKCPRKDCDKIIVINKDDIASVCDCDFSVCNKCLAEIHFPISCEDARMFREEFNFESHKGLITISGKNCPKCNLFIEKNGGCNHMNCRCGASFCWNCLKGLNQHTGECKSKTMKQVKFEDFDSSLVQKLNEISILGQADRFDGFSEKINSFVQKIKPNLRIIGEIFEEKSWTISIPLEKFIYNGLFQIKCNTEQMIAICKYVLFKEFIDSNNKELNVKLYDFIILTINICSKLKTSLYNGNNLNDLYNIFILNHRLKQKFSKIINREIA